jgi:hypothetical protein
LDVVRLTFGELHPFLGTPLAPLKGMLRRLSPLEEGELGEIFEREFEEGVHVDYPLDLDESSSQTLFGGVLIIREDTHVVEAPPRHRPRRK